MGCGARRSCRPYGARATATRAFRALAATHGSLTLDAGVSKALLQIESVLLSHGISKLAPKGCGPFVAREHAVVSTSASGKLPVDGETVMVAETVRAGYRYDATGAVLRRAKMRLAPAPLDAMSVPTLAGQRSGSSPAAESREPTAPEAVVGHLP